jgi:hypothetical protein
LPLPWFIPTNCGVVVEPKEFGAVLSDSVVVWYAIAPLAAPAEARRRAARRSSITVPAAGAFVLTELSASLA